MGPIIIGVIIIAFTGIFFTAQTRVSSAKKPSPSPVIETPSPSPSLSPTPSLSITNDQDSNSVKIIINNSPSPTPTPTPHSEQATGDFQYPGSTKTGDNSYESSDDPQKITDWYKSKIQNLGFNSKSFVQTNTNGNILNKLVGGKSGSEISVEIKRSSGSSTTQIVVSTS